MLNIVLILFFAVMTACVFVATAHQKRLGSGQTVLRIASVLLTLCMAAVSCMTSISAGFVGLPVNFGQLEGFILTPGLHFVLPWTQIVKMDTREQRIPFETLAFSKDIQEVSLKGSVNIVLDSDTALAMYEGVGTEYVGKLVTPRVMDALKGVVSSLSADELIARRSEISIAVQAALVEHLEGYGLTIASVAIEDIDFTDAFTDAVEAKQVAAQELLRATTLQDQKTMEATQAAERAKISAQADADIARINAEAEAYVTTTSAEAEAKANKAIADSLTIDLLQWIYANQWDGKLPSVVVGEDTMVPEVKLAVE